MQQVLTRPGAAADGEDHDRLGAGERGGVVGVRLPDQDAGVRSGGRNLSERAGDGATDPGREDEHDRHETSGHVASAVGEVEPDGAGAVVGFSERERLYASIVHVPPSCTKIAVPITVTAE